jgi:hypothetical protein
MRRQHQVIPNPRTANDALAVTDGAVTIGSIIRAQVGSELNSFQADSLFESGIGHARASFWNSVK